MIVIGISKSCPDSFYPTFKHIMQVKMVSQETKTE